MSRLKDLLTIGALILLCAKRCESEWGCSCDSPTVLGLLENTIHIHGLNRHQMAGDCIGRAENVLQQVGSMYNRYQDAELELEPLRKEIRAKSERLGIGIEYNTRSLDMLRRIINIVNDRYRSRDAVILDQIFKEAKCVEVSHDRQEEVNFLLDRYLATNRTIMDLNSQIVNLRKEKHQLMAKLKLNPASAARDANVDCSDNEFIVEDTTQQDY